MATKVTTSKSDVKSKVVAKKTGAKKSVSKAKLSKPTSEEIKARAYEIYLESGHKGTEIENWLKAEKELKGKK
ncbi:MAG TPA: hypothetical protein DCG75_03730 [Bacteroidales bacterium]|jgi:hypothetical protein|nr:hypothetical protein [Bacteroidales bacterium]